MYNQKHHSFDRFYNHKFGFHINGPHQGAFEAVFRLKPRIVKTLDFSVEVLKRMKQEIPDLFIIGRLFVHPQDFGQLSGNTAEVARQRGVDMAEKILREEVNRHQHNGKPLIDAWESLNETFPEWSDDNTHKLFNEYQVAFGQKIRAAGFEPIAFNFGQGNGNGPQWLKFYAGTLETYNYLGFHEYDWPTLDRLHNVGLNGPVEMQNRVPGGEGRGNDGMWRCLRYRRVMNNGIRQAYNDKHTVIITECGMTQAVWGGQALDIGPWAKEMTVAADIKGGTVPSPIPVEDYWRSLQWYNSELMKDDYVMGACLFVTGATGKAEWETFEHLGPIMDRIAAFQQEIQLDPNITTPVPSMDMSSAQPAVVQGSSQPPQAQPAAAVSAGNIPQAEPAVMASSPAAPAPTSSWTYSLSYGSGLPLLVGDIGVKDETITIIKPNGMVDRPKSGSKGEYGLGGFEAYASERGMYEIQFLGQSFKIEMGGQFTRLNFSRQANPSSVQVQVSLRDGRTNYRRGEKVFMQIAVTNVSQEAVPFGILGLLGDGGQFQTSWDNGLIKVGETFRHEDGMSFDTAGAHTLQLSICFAKKDECTDGQHDSSWVRFEPKLPFTVE